MVTQLINVVDAHRFASKHRAQVESSDQCGCFYCLQTFSPSAITQWTDDQQTALCPQCGIDAVLGSASGAPLTPAFLRKMHSHWFHYEPISQKNAHQPHLVEAPPLPCDSIGQSRGIPGIRALGIRSDVYERLAKVAEKEKTPLSIYATGIIEHFVAGYEQLSALNPGKD